MAGVSEAIAAAGAEQVYLPPYSPDFSPIEKCWSKLKALLRAARARERAVLDNAVAAAVKRVHAGDAAGWFTCCGYAYIDLGFALRLLRNYNHLGGV